MKVISSNLTVYGLAHGVVDAMCGAVLFSLLSQQAYSAAMTTYLFVIYNLLAFGLQVIIGFFIDNFKAPRFSALLGIILTGVAIIILPPFPVGAVVLAGIGNAFFHVGGGIASLSLTPRKATAPGIFVAPGAIGLMAGTLLGKSGNFTAWPFVPVLAALAVLIFLIPRPTMYRRQINMPPHSNSLPPGARGPERGIRARVLNENSPEFKFEYILYLVLFVIAIRSLVGFAVVFPWKADISLLVMLTLSVALGKGLGGFLADRFGWAKTTVGSLLVSIPLLTLGAGIPVCGMIGMFLFNITMPVTLTLVSNMIPGRPGTAFGLTCLALVLGTLPAFSALQPGLNSPVFFDAVILISALALFVGLRYYYRAAANGVRPGLIPGAGRKLQED